MSTIWHVLAEKFNANIFVIIFNLKSFLKVVRKKENASALNIIHVVLFGDENIQ